MRRLRGKGHKLENSTQLRAPPNTAASRLGANQGVLGLYYGATHWIRLYGHNGAPCLDFGRTFGSVLGVSHLSVAAERARRK